MSVAAESSVLDVEARARRSRGTSGSPIYDMVARALAERHPGGGVLLDVGCGVGNLWSAVHDRFDRYLGADVVCYEGFPEDGEFLGVDLDGQGLPLADGYADVTTAVETIEHLENPRALFRELVRVTRPGGWVVVTTPNQLSLLSKLTLLMKNQFNAFQDGCYPAHLSALLEVDLRRIAVECRLEDVHVRYSEHGRAPATQWHYPRVFARALPRALSDNVLVMGKKTNA